MCTMSNSYQLLVYFASSYKEHFPPLQDLQKDVDYVHDVYDQLGKDFPIVFCHLDCHVLNIIHDKASGKFITVNLQILAKLNFS